MSFERVDDPGPSGYTIDGTPWEEPRGPHLPDAITRQPILIWPFVALAAVIAGQAATRLVANSPLTPDVVARTGLSAVDPVATVLLGAAWFWRHRRPGDQPRMAAGLTLLAVVEAMRLASPWIHDRFAPLSGAGDDPFASVQLDGIWSTVEGVVTIVALLLLFRAISAARRQPASARQPAAILAIAVLATIVVGFQIWFVATLAGASGEALVQQNLSLTLLAIVSLVMNAVVIAALLAGALAGEAPPIAWRLGALGFLLPFGGSLVSWLTVWFSSANPAAVESFYAQIAWLQVIVQASGAIALLAAVIRGLPSIESASCASGSGSGSGPAA